MRSPALPTIIATIGDELRTLGVLAADLQDGLAHVSMEHDPGSMEQLQSLDLLTQRLAGLAKFMADVAVCVPADCHPDLTTAIGEITLTHLQHRLSAVPVPNGADAGLLELFA